ncbi:MAG TPA: SemiSWEET family transporter [Gaiellaceae bacterium]|jgi:uncharacterized protein with PQ loop repeat
MATAFGWAAATWAVVMALAPVLQVREILRRKSSAGISVGYMLVLIVGFALWVLYGIARGDTVLFVPNTLAFIVMAGTVAIVIRFR